MGQFTEGEPLTYEQMKKIYDHVRRQGVLQFINLYEKHKNRTDRVFKWGDEVEYMIVKFDHDVKKAKLSLRAEELLDVLGEKERVGASDLRALWRPEYAAYMVEGTPAQPYTGDLPHLNTVEHNMRSRRAEVERVLKPGETVMSLTSFPRLGCDNFSCPPTKPDPTEGASKSLFFPDEAIYQGNPRYKIGTANIRMRKGEKVGINIPAYKDINTSIPKIPNSEPSLTDHVYLDAMGFGMGHCCLQVTFQTYNLNEAVHLYDQLIPLCPILLALTAGTPVERGYLIDADCRWNILASMCDCRTREERGLEPLKNSKYVINKSRYDSVDSYLSEQGNEYNDINLVCDVASYELLQKHKVEDRIAKHIAHLFIRDTMIQFEGKIDQDCENETQHFENIQSTNWQTMRFKPPPLDSDIGWRIEFRPCEAQTTDFENAAVSCFIILLTRVILSFRLNTLIPITKVDENMQSAQKQNAYLTEQFWFRRDLTSSDTEGYLTQLTLDEIFNGKQDDGEQDNFPGLIPLIEKYLDVSEIDVDTRCSIQRYLKLISARASGKLMTTAAWIRKFVTGHPAYGKDSVVSDEINYDLLKALDLIQKGVMSCPELLGQLPILLTTENNPKALNKCR